jgi:hypothetical protein
MNSKSSRTPAPRSLPTSRAAQVQRLRRRLLQRGWPRLQMLLIVALTAGAGLLASLLLLSGGMQSMGLRYALSVAVAYLVFLALLWVWLRSDSRDYLDVPNLPSPRDTSSSGAGQCSADSGNGASFDFDAPKGVASDADASASLAETGLGDALGGADEAAIPLVLLLVLLALLCGVVFVIANVVWSAPVLFAELLFDGVLAAGLYRRINRVETRHWIGTALRHTFWPFALSLVLVAAAGFGLQHLHPEAVTLGQALGGIAIDE